MGKTLRGTSFRRSKKMSERLRLREIGWLALLFILLEVPAYAQIPAVPKIPGSLPHQFRTQLIVRAKELSARFDRLRSDGNALNKQCANIVEGSADDQKCKNGQATWNTERSEYADAVAKLKQDIVDALDSTICATRARIKIDQAAIASMGVGFEAQSEAFADWNEISNETKRKALNALIGGLLTGMSKSAVPIGSLTPPKANQIVSSLQRKGVTDPVFLDAIRGLAATPGKPLAREAVETFVKKTQRFLAAGEIASGDDPTEEMKAVSKAVAEASGHEELALAINDGDFLVYLVNLTNREDQLDAVVNDSDAQLKHLKGATDHLRDDVNHLNDLKTALKDHGNAPPPSCDGQPAV
jgi:hypothetical protein